jgi:hypothetical protein
VSIEAVTAHAGGNSTALVARYFAVDRPTRFKLARMLTFIPASVS